ncbi:MAG TPA: ATP-binding protein [Longimicrobium sp.]|jgi:PAS domain S-box-containing protein|uniref:ATP-binding protein n=1 Tax=Longimicrobium sp. TaxID=2029185 RepID=UPI002ED788F6
MSHAPILYDRSDPARLASLRSTELLDAPPDEVFDRLTRLAARLVQAPAAFVNLVDGRRDFFQSCFGFGEPLSTVRQLEETTFCHYALGRSEPLVINDARAHPVYRAVPAVESMGLTAYVGVPLHDAQGRPLGTFCVVDYQPREWTQDETGVLMELAGSAEREIRLRQERRSLLGTRHSLEQALREQAAERAFSATVLNTADALIVVSDVDGRIVRFNRACERLTGWSEDEMRGRYFTHFLDPADVPDVVEMMGDLAAGEFARRHEHEWITRSGARRRIAWSNAAIAGEDGTVTHVVASGIDVTEQRELDRLKDEFAAVVSHELRTPLTSIRGALGLLAGLSSGAIDDERAQRLVKVASRNADRLTELTNSILTIERLRAGRDSLDLQALDAGELLAAAAETVGGSAEAGGVALVTHPAAFRVVADGPKLAQVLMNLIGNAVKFSPAGSMVEIRAEALGDHARFAVQDRGRGIPADKLDTVFERFRQVHSDDAREKGGSGLGLAIARGIVEQHGGRIWVESELGAGSTFFFTIPMDG